MMENHEENADVEEDDIVEEYVSTPADLERIRNHYAAVDEDGNALDNPAFCLNIASSSIRNIPHRALHNCRELTDLRVQHGGGERILLRSIGRSAFWNCKRLRRINQFLKEGGVIRLEREAFGCCESIEGELVIPSSIIVLGSECFCDCTSITSVVFEPSTTGTVVEINYGVFHGCTELSLATLPPTLECIPRSCFGMCTSLINNPIPPTVVELGAYAFEMCTSLPSMDLPESLDVIGKETFFNCTALTTVTIRTPSFDLQMGDNIFGRCTALTTIQMYPWHWGKLLSSMKNDTTFLHKFFNGTLTPLHQIHLTSWYGARILESVNNQPSLLYRVLRQFQQQRFETTDRVDMIEE